MADFFGLGNFSNKTADFGQTITRYANKAATMSNSVSAALHTKRSSELYAQNDRTQERNDAMKSFEKSWAGMQF